MTAVEEKVRAHFVNGDVCDLSGTDPVTGRAGPDDDSPPPETQDLWSDEQRVPAAFLTELLLEAGRQESRWLKPRLRLVGARITGELDLNGLTVAHDIELFGCLLEEIPNFGGSRLRYVGFYGCRMPGLSAWNVVISNSLSVENSVVEGPSDISGGRIQGQLLLMGSTLTGADGAALFADDLHVGRTINLNGAWAKGEIGFERARIGGALSLRGARLENPGGVALHGASVQVRGGLLLAGPFGNPHPEPGIGGDIILDGSHIGARFEVSGLRSLPGGTSLSCERVRVNNDVVIDDETRIDGYLNLSSADVAGDVTIGGGSAIIGGLTISGLRCGGAVTISEATIGEATVGEARIGEARVPATEQAADAAAPSGPTPASITASDDSGPGDDTDADLAYAIEAFRMTVAHNVRLVGVTATRGIALAGSKVDGSLLLEECTFSRPAQAGAAVLLDGVRVGQDLGFGGIVDGFLTANDATVGAGALLVGDVIATTPLAIAAVALSVSTELTLGPLTTAGAVSLQGASIGERLSIVSTRITSESQPALLLGNMTTNAITVGPDVTVAGFASLAGAHVTDEVDLSGLTVTEYQPGSDELTGLHAERLHAGVLHLPETIAGLINLTDASVNTLQDSRGTWRAGRYVLVGLRYQNLEDNRLPMRLRWLRRMRTYHDQPYRQLATYYRETGDDVQARRVMLRSRRRRNRRAPLLVRPLGWLYDAFSGYGYSPLRAGYWLVGAVLAGMAYLAYRTSNPIRGFDGFVTSLDLVLPGSPLGSDAGATPTDDAGKSVWFGLEALGWLLSLSVGPTVARALSRDQREAR